MLMEQRNAQRFATLRVKWKTPDEDIDVITPDEDIRPE